MQRRVFSLLVALLLILPVLPTAVGARTAAAAAGLTVQVLSPRGEPLAGAQVQVMAPGQGILATAVTDDAGRGAIGGVNPEGAYWVRIWAEGYQTLDHPWVPGADGPHLSLTLTPLLADLSGQVLDPQGAAVAGAEVSLWHAQTGLTARALAGDDGRYVLRGIPVPGPYRLQVAAPGHRPFWSGPVELAPAAPNHLDATLTPSGAVVRGQVVDARTGAPVKGSRVELLQEGWGVLALATTAPDGSFSLMAPPGAGVESHLRVWAPGYRRLSTTPFSLRPGEDRSFTGADRLRVEPTAGTIWGVVTDDAGAGMAGVTVDLQRQGRGTIAQARTAAGGLFQFDEVPPGTYRLRVQPPRSYSDWSVTDSTWFDLAAGGRRYLALTAGRFELHGYGDGIILGVVTDPAGAPIAGAQVTVLRGDGRRRYETTTDQQGRYRLAGVEANRSEEAGDPAGMGYLVRVEKPGFFPSDQPNHLAVLNLNSAGGDAQPGASIAPAAAAAPARFVDLWEQQVTQADFTLWPVSGRLLGTVQDQEGRSLVGAQVTLYREGVGPLATATTQTGGRFRFDQVTLQPGVSLWLMVEKEGYLPAAVTPDPEPGRAPGQEVWSTVRLRSVQARLSGQVTGALGTGVAGAQVRVLDLAGGRTWKAETDAGGWYRLTGLPAGPEDWLLVQAENPGAPPQAAPGPIGLDGRRGQVLHLSVPEMGTAAGTVSAAGGGVLAGAEVSLW